jgi:acyl carrier protein
VTGQDVRSIVLDAIHRVAPEIDPSSIRPAERLRAQVDIDSMDFLSIVIDLHEKLQVDIPEADYGRLTTIDEMVRYIEARIAATPRSR